MKHLTLWGIIKFYSFRVCRPVGSCGEAIKGTIWIALFNTLYVDVTFTGNKFCFEWSLNQSWTLGDSLRYWWEDKCCA